MRRAAEMSAQAGSCRRTPLPAIARRRCGAIRRAATGDSGGAPPPPPPQQQPEPQIRLSDPAQTVIAGGRLPSRRRLIGGGLTAAAVALGGNLGGVTSALLALDGGRLAGRLRLDVLVPVKGLKRCVDAANGFEFSYPAAWLGDQTLVRRAAQRAELARGLDPPPLRGAAVDPRRRGGIDPVVAFGPAGSTGELNVSVIAAPITPGFRLESLGSPADAALRFLNTTVAPPGSDRTAELLAASERRDDAGNLYYTFEFTVRKEGGFFRHNVSVLASRGDVLFTLNAQCPEARWGAEGRGVSAAAATFRLLPAPARRRQ